MASPLAGVETDAEHGITMPAPGTTKILSVAEFKSECAINASQLEKSEVAANEIGITAERLEQIKEVCDMQTQLMPDLATFDRSRSSLKCVQHHRRAVPFLERHEQNSVTYSNLATNKDKWSHQINTPVPNGEIILCIDIFHPTKQVRDQHFLVLATQRLTALRDKILCPNDYVSNKDMSEDPSVLAEEQLKDVPTSRAKSAFFFVGNTFYNDRRDCESRDVSRGIISWAEEGGRMAQSAQLDHFDTVDMENTTFEKLKMKLGYPYLYSHHGNCEHLIIFRDMRLFNPKCDALYIEDYPFLHFYNKMKRQTCQSCSKGAMWLTCDDELAPNSPCFFCLSCLVKLHYSGDGKKLCQFKLYRYQIPYALTVD